MSWPLVTLETVCEINVGRTPSRDNRSYWATADHSWVSISDMSRARFIEDTKESFSEKARVECNMRLVRAGTVLLSFKLSIGKVSIASRDLFTNEAIAALPVLDKGVLDSAYLARALESLSFVDAGSRAVMGKTLNKAGLRQIKIPLPPLSEQRRIVAILDQADTLRRLRRQSLACLSDLGKAIFDELFGGLITDNHGWKKLPFADIAERITVGVVVKPASYYVDRGIPAIRGTNIKANGIDLSDVVYFSEATNENILSKTRVWTDDLVIVRSGRPGLAALVPPNLSGCNTIDVLIMTPDKQKIRPRFLRDLVNSPTGRRMVLRESRGQVQQHFNVGSLASAITPLPPLEIQDVYIRRIEALEKVVDETANQLIISDGLFTSLQRRAFNGEL